MTTDPNAPVTTNGTPATPSTTAPTSGNPGNGTGAATGTATTPEPFRFGPNAPEWARNLTPDQLLGITEQAVAQLAKFNQSPQVPQQQYQAPQTTNRFDLDQSADDDFISVKQARALMAQAQQGDPVARQLAIGGNMQAIRQSNAEYFKRWGPELEMEINKIPPEMRTLDNLQLVVNMVRGNHVQELVDEKARQQAVQLSQDQVAAIRSGSGGSQTIPNTQNFDLKSNDLPEEWRELASKHNLTLDQVREFTQATGETMEQYFATVKKFGKGGIIHG